MGFRKGGGIQMKVQASAKTQKPAGTFGSDYNGSLLATETNNSNQQQIDQLTDGLSGGRLPVVRAVALHESCDSKTGGTACWYLQILPVGTRVPSNNNNKLYLYHGQRGNMTVHIHTFAHA